ncbi:CBY1-interacting BAR domain-containing protein 1 [Acropora cervicornis]|uniref:CBY1-interacting BAR domain-containing protein 1 n=1 Tax=Acropora cervicornis TaxID=6130 RepID=A0AAD9UYL0_ACRCE|nr:CBY1-interacting BAR domain-containing protein 1 [Acropora cervicornis]
MKKSSSNSSVASPSEIRSETKARDHELKVISERISCAERHFSILLKDFTAFSSGLISMQDKGMRISKSVDVYSDQEYPSLKASLAGADYIQEKVLPPLALNSRNCKHARDYVKELNAAREKQSLKQKALDKLKTKEKNSGKIVEQDLQKLAADARRARQTLEYQMVEFERKKIQDIKTVFSCFFHGQMLFHAKALELYTAAFQNVFSMDEEQDIEAFQNDLHSTQSASRQDLNNTQTPINRFGSQGSLGSQMSLKDGQSEREPDEDDSEISDFE